MKGRVEQNGQMGNFMKEYLRTGSLMEKVNLGGPMEEFLKAIIKMVLKMEKVKFIFLEMAFTKDIGKMETLLELECILSMMKY